MRNTRQRLARAIAIACVVGIAAIFCAPFLGEAHWSGRARLDVTFKVVDAATQQPLPEATVDLYPADFHDPPHELLTTDQTGQVVRQWPKQSIDGVKSLWRDEVFVPLPDQLYSASAPGYQSSPEQFLADNEHRERVAYRPGFASVTVVIPLAREAAP